MKYPTSIRQVLDKYPTGTRQGLDIVGSFPFTYTGTRQGLDRDSTGTRQGLDRDSTQLTNQSISRHKDSTNQTANHEAVLSRHRAVQSQGWFNRCLLLSTYQIEEYL